eukprot:scaffold175689_cov32-Prasinocladus_malaysianus.AAC.1
MLCMVRRFNVVGLRPKQLKEISDESLCFFGKKNRWHVKRHIPAKNLVKDFAAYHLWIVGGTESINPKGKLAKSLRVSYGGTNNED